MFEGEYWNIPVDINEYFEDICFPNGRGKTHKSTRKKFVWVDKAGKEHKLADMGDYYLKNIINMLNKFDEPPCGIIRFLEEELQYRADCNRAPVGCDSYGSI